MRDLPGESVRLVRDVLLRDGSTLRLQAPGPADYEDIRAFYEQLSPQSRYFRFHGIGRTDIVARAAVESSGIDRVSLIARHDGRVIAACSYEGLREPGVAEIALAVAEQPSAMCQERCRRRGDASPAKRLSMGAAR